LTQHLEGIQTEANAAYRRWQEWLHVSVVTSLTHWVGLCIIARHKSHVKAQLDFFIVIDRRCQREGIIINEFDLTSAVGHLLFELPLIVFLIEHPLLLGELDLLEEWFQI